MSGEASYAETAAKGPKQTAEEAAAPQPPQVTTSTSASTASLVDVDTPSVRTVPSDFAEQDIKTETQAERVRLEQEQKEQQAEVGKAKAKAKAAREKAAGKTRRADDWLVEKLAALSDGAASALAVGNLAVAMGLGAVVGYKVWDLYERGALTWKSVGLGTGLLGVIGLGESIFAAAWYKAKGKKQ